MSSSPISLSRRRVLRGAADPLLHAALAVAVTAPLARGGDRRPVVAAVAAGFVIDLDHVVAARSLKVEALWSLDSRPRTHSAVGAATAGAIAGVLGGPRYGWAVGGSLLAHILMDAAEGKTPVLWPLSQRSRIAPVAFAAGAGTIALGSGAIARWAARAIEAAGDPPPNDAVLPATAPA